jgi:plasmid maintenance system antidote protein VapI
VSHRVSVSAAELTQDSAAVVPSPDESGIELTPSRPRAKAIARPTRIVAARVFSAAIEACGYSYRQVARWLEVDERRVRQMVAGERPVPLDVVLALPPRFESAVAVAIEVHAKARAIPMVRR